MRKECLWQLEKKNIDIEYDEPNRSCVRRCGVKRPLRIARPRGLGAAHDRADLPHFQAQDQAACHRQCQHCQELRCPGFRIYDYKNGLFVKEPQRSYVKNGTEMTSSVFFPVTKEARDALYSQILTPTNW